MSATAVKWWRRIRLDVSNITANRGARQQFTKIFGVPISLSEVLSSQPAIRNCLDYRRVIENGITYGALLDPR
jgi:hypothetical protein